MAVVLSCHGQVPFELPQSQLNPASGLLIFADDSGDSVWAFEGPVPSFSAKTGRSVALLYYARDLQTLGLTAGWLALAPAGDSGRPLPPYVQGFRAQRTAEGLGVWTPLGARDDIFSGIRLPGIKPQRCLAEGGCFASEADLGARICSADCVEREIAARPESPMAPSPVDFGACDPGWTPVPGSGGTYCAPLEPQTCADDEAQWPSAAGCVSLGMACPAPGEWAPDLPDDSSIIFVRPGAQGGDGSRPAPFGTLQAALSAVGSDGIIALTEGTYTAAVVSSGGVTVWGACVSGTLLQPASTIAFIGGQGGLRNLTLDSPAGGVRINGQGTQVILQDVVISGHEVGPAIEVATSSLTVNRVRIRGTADIPTSALVAKGRAYVQASSVMFEDNGGYTVWVQDRQTRVDIQDAQLSAQGRIFRTRGALYAFGGGELNLRSALVTDFRATGAVSEGAATQMSAEQVVFQRILDPDGAIGVHVGEGTSVDLSKVRIEGIEGAALRVDGGALKADRLYLGWAPDGNVGHIDALGGELQLARTYLEGSNRWGLRSMNAKLVLRDLHIAGVRRSWISTQESFLGVGLWLRAGTEIDAQRVLLEDLETHGVQAYTEVGEPGIRGALWDLHVRDVDDLGPDGGHGLDFRQGVDLEVTRARVEQTANIAVYLRERAETEFVDLEVKDARFGVRPTHESVTSLSRVLVAQTRSGAVCVRDDAQVRAEDLILVQTLGPSEQDAGGICADGMPAVGDGLLVNQDAFMQLQRYEISGSVATGIVSLAADAVHAADGRVTGNRVGVQFGAGTRLPLVILRTQISGNETDTLGIPED